MFLTPICLILKDNDNNSAVYQAIIEGLSIKYHQPGGRNRFWGDPGIVINSPDSPIKSFIQGATKGIVYRV